MTPSADETRHERRTARPRLHWSVRLLRTASIAYLAMVILLPFGKSAMLYPGAMLPQTPGPHKAADGATPFALQLSDGSELQGLFYTPMPLPAGAPPLHPDLKPPTILYFYGNASTVAHSIHEIELFRRCGANVLLVDYPGFGKSSGKPSEQAFSAAALALWDYAAAQPDVDERQILIMGWSLGGAVAIDLAWRRPAAGLVTLCTFTSLEDMARITLPIFPTRLFVGGEFDSIRKMPDLRLPVTILHSSDDEIIPFAMARQLANAAVRAPIVRYIPIRNTRHNDPFVLGYDSIRAAIVEQIQLIQHLRAAQLAEPAP